MDAVEVLKGSKLLRTCARAAKVHNCNAAVFNSAVQLLSMLLHEYKNSSCFDVLAEELVDSGLPLEIEIVVKTAQARLSFLYLITCVCFTPWVAQQGVASPPGDVGRINLRKHVTHRECRLT